MTQQNQEPVAQFSIPFTQLLIRADPTMSETMKLYFLWRRLRHDLARRVRDEGPSTLTEAINIAQRIEETSESEIINTSGVAYTHRERAPNFDFWDTSSQPLECKWISK